MRRPKKVLIAHQWTIPHYRLHFYNKLSELKSDAWDFTVIYDKNKTIEKFYVDLDDYEKNFKVINKKAYKISGNNKDNEIVFQSFLFTALKYDLIIVEHAINNLSYPAVLLLKLFGKKIAFWGTGRDYSNPNPKGWKERLEKFKIILAKKGEGFFAYTNGVKNYLLSKGVDCKKIFVLNNTIDINENRKIFLKLLPKKTAMKDELGLTNCKVLLYVGRIQKRKRVDFLIEAFLKLLNTDSSFRLILIGGGIENLEINDLLETHPEIMVKGIVPDEELSKYFVISDLYLFPGSVGLGPLHALCYDLIPVVIDSLYHNAEYEYLNKSNCIILPNNVTTSEYVECIIEIFSNYNRLNNLKANAWPSIKHLTLEKMAMNYITGVNSILNL